MRIQPIALTAFIAAAAALLAASPADAQSRGKPRPEARPDWNQNVQGRRDVYVFGRNMGTDPDPNIRYQIRRDVGAATGGDD